MNLNIFIYFFLLLVGLSGLFSQIAVGSNRFDAFSPATKVFTRKSDRGNNVVFKRYNKDVYIDQINFDRKFYKNLGGPHRYKIVFLNLMRRAKNYNTTPEYANFVRYYICVYPTSLNSKLKPDNVKTFNNNRFLNVFSCG